MSELACLVDAIPAQFRRSLLQVAIGLESCTEWKHSQFVLSLRSQVQECVHDRLGFKIADCVWQKSDFEHLGPLLRALGRCSDPAQSHLAVCDVLTQLAASLLTAAKEV